MGGKNRGATVAALLVIGVLIAAALAGPAGAHKGGAHIWKVHVRPKLQTPGTLNNPVNPVDWTKLKGVPAGFADGTDDAGTGDITAVNAGTGLTGGGSSGDVSLSTDPTTTQTRVNGSCGAGSSVRVVNQDGSVVCETDDTGAAATPEVGGAKAVNSETQTFTSSTAFVNVPGATLNITVPDGTTMLVSARFMAESSCSGAGASEWCSLKIVIGGVDGAPDADGNFAFDSTDGGTEGGGSWESHAFECYRTLGAGNYTVLVQQSVTDAAVSLALDDWTLIVERNLVAP